MDYTPIHHAQYSLQHTSIITSNNVTMNCHLILQIIIDFNKANALIQTKKYREALPILDRNITLLGDQYLSSKINISDDTGIKLILGTREQIKGNWETAAYLKRNVLESRIQVFQTGNQCFSVK